MAIQTFAAASNLLKRVYFPGIRDQLNNETPGLGVLNRTGKEQWSGAEVRMATRTGRNRSYRATRSANESAALPTAGRQTYNNFVMPCVLVHGTGGLTAFGAAATQGSESAFEQMLRAEVQGLIADQKKDLEIDFFGNAAGILGKVNGDPGVGTTVTLDQAQSLVHWESNGNRYFSPGQLVDFVRQDGGAVNVTGAEIASVASANRTEIVLTAAAAAIGDDDIVVRSGTLVTEDVGGAVADNTEASFSFFGLEHLIDDGTTVPARDQSANYELDVIMGIDRGVATNSFANGTVLDRNNAELLRDSVNNLIYSIEERGASYPDVIMTHRSVQNAMANLMIGDQRYQPQEFPGGFKATTLVWNAGDRDVPVLVARECPYDRLYALSLDCIEHFVLQDFELIETDGSVLRQSGNGDAWSFSYRRFANIGSRQPNGNGKIVRIGSADEGFATGAGRIYDF
tara:strand:- start:1469 stop:2836 length:1368 start_codon:yes stop_codon:yes gene_type:complete